MLSKRTKSLIETIDQNIKIGFGILFVLIALFALDDLILSPVLMKEFGENLDIPGWVLFINVFSNFLIITTFIYFVIKYYRVKKSCDMNCNLKETLIKIIDTLKIYRTMFYLAVITFLVAIGSSFVSGMYKGFLDGVQEKGMLLSEVQGDKIALVILIGLAILIFLTGLVFFFLSWGFKKLYGNYIHKLKLTLRELQEIEE
jgi:Na+/melibiose symporter-like transporter